MRGGGGRGRGSRGGGRLAPGLRPVEEGTRISIAEVLDNFRRSDDKGVWIVGVVV